jgi:hypothetical protein
MTQGIRPSSLKNRASPTVITYVTREGEMTVVTTVIIAFIAILLAERWHLL